MFDLNWIAWLIVSLSSFLIGITKTGVPGAGTLAVALMATVLPARASLGVSLLMRISADIFAATYYRHDVQWQHLFRLTPWTLGGIFLGYFALDRVNDRQLGPIIGGIIFVMLGLNRWRAWSQEEDPPIPTCWWFAALLGLLAGITTMMANAAGPIMVIYLLTMRVPKIEFIATSVWYFFIVNWIKVPFSANLGLINADSLSFNLVLLPLIAMGAAAGILAAQKIPQKAFSTMVQILAASAALHLLLYPVMNLFTSP